MHTEIRFCHNDTVYMIIIHRSPVNEAVEGMRVGEREGGWLCSDKQPVHDK